MEYNFENLDQIQNLKDGPIFVSPLLLTPDARLPRLLIVITRGRGGQHSQLRTDTITTEPAVNITPEPETDHEAT